MNEMLLIFSAGVVAGMILGILMVHDWSLYIGVATRFIPIESVSAVAPGLTGRIHY